MNGADIDTLYSVALGSDKSPDSWQRDLATKQWPDVLIAPTGSGKTAAVTLGWAARRIQSPSATRRRLVWCLPMRTLVEQTAVAVREWFDRLSQQGIARGTLPSPDDVHMLMGGVEAADWLIHPERAAVIVGTQDMLLSRALMRGYAASRAIWPMEFGLLHEDTQWVFDEVQLMGSGRATSAQLEAFRRLQSARTATPNGKPACSLWVSATLEPDWLRTVDFPTPNGQAVMRVETPSSPNSRLRTLATAKKRLARARPFPASRQNGDMKRYLAGLAEAVLDAHRPGHLSLVIVNRVKRAQDLHIELRKRLKRERPDAPALGLLHGRFRSADRQREAGRLPLPEGSVGDKGLIVVATQAIEAGIDVSAAVLFTELAPWSAMVQRFGRANRYAKLSEGADVRWVDLLGTEDPKSVNDLSLPYAPEELEVARAHLCGLTDVAPINLPAAPDVDPPRRVIRRKDLDDLFDTDPDLTGFDVDVSAYVRDADDTDIRVFWRNLTEATHGEPPRPRADELCAVPIGMAKDWLAKLRKGGKDVFVRNPQWRIGDVSGNAPPGWVRFGDSPWPGMTLLADVTAGGYDDNLGFTGNPKDMPEPVETADESPAQPQGAPSDLGGESDGHDEDPRSEIGVPVTLSAHLRHVAEEAEVLCDALAVDADTRERMIRAARWHDVGKVHDAFQDTMRRGLPDESMDKVAEGVALAKTVKSGLRHRSRPYFRHELASALALLSRDEWSRETDLTAYLVAAHHGKVRMNLRALPREKVPSIAEVVGARFARGVWEGDHLKPVDIGGGEQWDGGALTLSVMELGWDECSHESWTERTRDLLSQFGPFRLAWMETLVRVADWRASAKEQRKRNEDC